MNREIVSERLLLRPIEVDRAKALHSLWTDERVRRFLWDGETIPFERTRAIVEKSLILFEESGFGIWGVCDRSSKELLGFAGYWPFRTPPSIELLFGVAPEHWNRGIATESSRCVIRYGFEELGFQSVEASTDLANKASVRVLEKLGFLFQKRELVDGLDTVFYSLSRDDWKKSVNKPKIGNG